MRRYGQVYILDTEQATEERQRHPGNRECDRDLLMQLHDYMVAHNPYAQSFKLMSEVAKKEEEEARRTGKSVKPIRMVFETRKSLDKRR